MDAPKGLVQVLAERGLYKPGMRLQEMREVLGRCPDFKAELGILENVLLSRGHILRMSPKSHPEVAGCGVEYVWVYTKLRFRRQFNNRESKKLRVNVFKSFDPQVIDVCRCRQYVRKNRDYLLVYKVIAEQMTKKSSMNQQQALAAAAVQIRKEGTMENMICSLVDIEGMLEERKTHRNIVDIDKITILFDGDVPRS